MKLYYEDDTVQLYLGDSLTVLPTLPDASVDAIVCDPPYELGFMGKAWDTSGIAYSVDLWRECWRVLKPGGHLLAFGGTRTYHRMTVAIEDAGFEIRDSLHWIYGSGFPKGQDIAKGIDRRRDDRARILQVTAWLARAVEAGGWNARRINELFGFTDKAVHWITQGKAAAIPKPEQWARLREAIGFDDSEIRPLVDELNSRKGTAGAAWSERPAGSHASRPGVAESWTDGKGWNGRLARGGDAVLEEARPWQGWNTALKPAHEPIVLARKSTGFNTTVANVLEHGTGALNIDGCRTEAGQDYGDKCDSVVGLDSNRNGDAYGEWTNARESSTQAAGRWPSNVLFGHDCDGRCAPGCPVGDLGEVSRFFPAFRYEAKAPNSERPRLTDGTAHTTVKPLALMRWLVRLVTPPGGTVLDPFAGSGATLEACRLEDFRSIGIEKDAAHAELCRIRLDKPYMTSLFDGGVA